MYGGDGNDYYIIESTSDYVYDTSGNDTATSTAYSW